MEGSSIPNPGYQNNWDNGQAPAVQNPTYQNNVTWQNMDGPAISNQTNYQANGTWQNRDGSSVPNAGYQGNAGWGNVETAASTPNPTYASNAAWGNVEGAAASASVPSQGYSDGGNAGQAPPVEASNGSDVREAQQAPATPQIPGKAPFFFSSTQLHECFLVRSRLWDYDFIIPL